MKRQIVFLERVKAPICIFDWVDTPPERTIWDQFEEGQKITIEDEFLGKEKDGAFYKIYYPIYWEHDSGFADIFLKDGSFKYL